MVPIFSPLTVSDTAGILNSLRDADHTFSFFCFPAFLAVTSLLAWLAQSWAGSMELAKVLGPVFSRLFGERRGLGISNRKREIDV